MATLTPSPVASLNLSAGDLKLSVLQTGMQSECAADEPLRGMHHLVKQTHTMYSCVCKVICVTGVCALPYPSNLISPSKASITLAFSIKHRAKQSLCFEHFLSSLRWLDGERHHRRALNSLWTLRLIWLANTGLSAAGCLPGMQPLSLQ